MQLFAIIETMFNLPNTSFLLVLIMSITSALLVNHILQAGFYTTLFSIPVLLVAGLFGNAFFIVNQVLLSPDRATNAAMSATFGFILIACMCFTMVRIWTRIRDKR